MRRCRIGVRMMLAAPMIASPENSAYADANSFPARVCSSSTGPMPPRIIDAFRIASIHGRFSRKWYPATPMASDTAPMMSDAATNHTMRDRNSPVGASGS